MADQLSVKLVRDEIGVGINFNDGVDVKDTWENIVRQVNSQNEKFAKGESDFKIRVFSSGVEMPIPKELARGSVSKTINSAAKGPSISSVILGLFFLSVIFGGTGSMVYQDWKHGRSGNASQNRASDPTFVKREPVYKYSIVEVGHDQDGRYNAGVEPAKTREGCEATARRYNTNAKPNSVFPNVTYTYHCMSGYPYRGVPR